MTKIDVTIMIGQAPDSHLRQDSRRESGKVVRLVQSLLQAFAGDPLAAENACEATSLVENLDSAEDLAHQQGFSWPDTRTTSASHLGNKNALWATHCSYAATWQISVHAPDHPENLRNATAIVTVAATTIPPNPARDTTTTILQCNSNNNTFMKHQQPQPHARTPSTVDSSVAKFSRAVRFFWT